MNAETNESQHEQFRLSTEQQAEIGDILLSARAVSRQMILQAQEQADGILQKATEEAGRLVREAEEQAEQITRQAEEQAAEKLREAETNTPELPPTGEEEAGKAENAAPGLSEEMQEYVVRCVGDCFARLRQQQLETAEFINEQWRAFLSGLSLPELPTPGAVRTESEQTGISRQDIEDRVSAIARELMEIIGK